MQEMPHVDENRLVELFEELVNVPSVVAYYPEIDKKLEDIFSSMGYEVSYDNKHTLYVKVKGRIIRRQYALEPILIRSV